MRGKTSHQWWWLRPRWLSRLSIGSREMLEAIPESCLSKTNERVTNTNIDGTKCETIVMVSGPNKATAKASGLSGGVGEGRKWKRNGQARTPPANSSPRLVWCMAGLGQRYLVRPRGSGRRSTFPPLGGREG